MQGGHAAAARARLVLGIETSCDDTSVAVLEDGTRLRAHLIAAQDLHRLYGGVVPELAARAHLELLPRMVAAALDEAGVAADRLTAIAVTHAPGLVGSLVVGVAFARAFGLALGIPVVGVNHIEGHLLATLLEHGEPPWPAVSLVVSGGHTELVEIRGVGAYRWLGSTRDDAAGEAYDKVAKLLGLGFPGGPPIDRLAATGDPAAFDFPRPMLDQPGFEFSFSGLKTAVAMTLARAGGGPPFAERFTADVAASFQRAVVDTLAAKSLRAIEATGARALLLGGGVACNGELRRRLTDDCARQGVALRIPAPRFCADNAAMIALVGARRLARGAAEEAELDAVASLEASGLSISAR
ncbi:MAG: tRNA (adenosine(37)-N6)-threonylcarbamoyltransferase complex transferase subunit TsaD [Candidatus Eisenbacteria bacterium]|uniref:tRNA N6-adenosine threonylcarbamoyltransferase n=1 Tax=Eiseniibacteriota bacterium TaxID=2212470 RepID=A0A9D6QI81_UNCEI|nr:tRNA (adenosine(37)-N6)-threonylcarbamoyltransferase complex transferase subunit TsaD [Candidatus Eisenbacteria bacterium]